METFLLLAANRWVQLGAAMAVILFLLARLAWVGADLRDAQLALEEAKADVTVCADVNSSNDALVKELSAKVAALTLQRITEADERQAMLEERDRQVAAAQQVADVERRKRYALFRSTQSCEGLAGLRVDLACPAIAERLRGISEGDRPQ